MGCMPCFAGWLAPQVFDGWRTATLPGCVVVDTHKLRVGILRATLRREGFGGISSPSSVAQNPAGVGSFRTVALTVPSAATSCPSSSGYELWLLLNAETSAAGQILASLLDATTLQPLPGFAEADAVPWIGNAVRAPVQWGSSSTTNATTTSADISQLDGKQVVVAVALRHAKLWAWEVQCVARDAAAAVR